MILSPSLLLSVCHFYRRSQNAGESIAEYVKLKELKGSHRSASSSALAVDAPARNCSHCGRGNHGKGCVNSVTLPVTTVVKSGTSHTPAN